MRRIYALPLVLYRGKSFDKHVVHAVESVVIDWCHQVRDVLKSSSASPLLEGKNPGPLVEIAFWKARCEDLESVVEQVCVCVCVCAHAHYNVL